MSSRVLFAYDLNDTLLNRSANKSSQEFNYVLSRFNN
jgi:hypothetical protein